MTGKIVNIAQQKGGAGKTTLVTHLAVAWAQKRGRTVAVLDVDPQGSLGVWYEARAHYQGDENTGLTFRRANGLRAMAEARALAKEHDLVVVDMPPHGTTSANAAIRAADLVVAPVQPTPLDFWATMPTLEVAAAEKKPVLLVLLRLLQGLALGGEYGGAAIYVAEHVPAERRGYQTSYINATASTGFLLSIAVVLTCRMWIDDADFRDWGWRIPFLVSVLLLAVSVYIRLQLEENGPQMTRISAQMKTDQTL